jgi:hypothetical protein
VPRRGLGLISGGGRRRRLLGALALVVAVAVVIGLVINSGSSGSPNAASNPGTVSGTATVQRRDLVETDTESGTLSYNNPETVYDRLSGTVTWLPSVGQEIKPGQALYKIAGEPVILMNGSTPAFRTLSSTDSDGPDVLELNRNLVALGFNADAIVVDDVWQPATTVGVELFQASLGETETDGLSLGRIAFLPGDQLVSAVDGTVGSTGAGGGSATADSGGSADASRTVGASAPEFVSLESSDRVPLHEAKSALSATTTTAADGAAGCPTTTTPATTPITTQTTTTTTTTATTTGTTPCRATRPKTRPTTGPTTTPPRRGRTGPGRPGSSSSSESKETLAALTALLKAETAQLKAEAAQLNAERGSSDTGHGSSTKPSSSSSAKSASGSGSGASKSSGGSGSGSGASKSSGGSGSGSGGSGGGGNAEAILQTTSTHLVVTVDLAATSQSEAVRGEHVTVEMPAGNTVDGKITGVSPVAESSSGSGAAGGSGSSGAAGGGSSSSSSTIPVTVTLSGHHAGAGLDQAAVSVNFAEAKAKNVLSLPVTALLATAGGGYAVQEAVAPHRLIPVTTGLFAAGYVQISGSGVYPGLQVTDSQG